MTIEIPDNWMGEPIQGSMKKVLASDKPVPRAEQPSGQPLNVQASINPREYVQVPRIKGIHGGDVLISKFEIPGGNDKNYEDAQRFVLERGLYVPTQAIFMPHFSNVVDAHRNNKQLFDGNGDPISRVEIEDMYKHLTKDHKAVYGQGTQEGAWTWLNGKFVKERSGFKKLGLETVVGKEQNGTFKTRVEPLKSHLDANQIYVDLAWNEQGLPTTKSSSDSYQQGENIRFWKPIDGKVARFLASSVRAYLDCDGGPGYRNASLGVFACAEGTASRENSGGSK